MKICVIGDLHFKENLSYSDYVKDRRIEEKKEILDFITKSSFDCDNVVILGDCFDTKNPTAETTKAFVSFVESFGDKGMYIISGNHSKRGNGSTALDFMKEIKNKHNWHIMTTPTVDSLGDVNCFFLPYMSKQEFGVSSDSESLKVILDQINRSNTQYLFAHHAISDTFSNGNVSTNTFHEVILPKKELEDKFDIVMAGHIHKPQQDGKTVISGSVFTSEAGETEKFIWKIDTSNNNVEKIKLPGRGIYKLENPTIEKLSEIPLSSIVKVIITSKDIKAEEIKEYIKRFDTFIFLEKYPNERKKLHFDEGAIDFSINNLLSMYSVEKGVPLDKLTRGMELILDK